MRDEGWPGEKKSTFHTTGDIRITGVRIIEAFYRE